MSTNDNALGVESLFVLLSTRAGLRFPPERHVSVAASMLLAMQRAGARAPADYVARIESGRASFDDLVEHVTVGETYFFREPDQLTYLREKVLPALIAKNGDRPIRIWSAACASGEEAYSLATSLELVGAAGTVLGTDISRPALTAARDAIYGAWSLRGPGAETARRFLHAEGDQWRVDARIRRRVTFRQLNLASDPFPGPARGEGPVDVIFCRNVLIYLEPAVVARVARGLFEALGEGGWLFTSSSDPPLREHAPFEHVLTDVGLFYRRPQARAPESTEPARAVRVRESPAALNAPSGASRAKPLPSSRKKASLDSLRQASQQVDELSAEACYVRAISLIDQRRDAEASEVLKRALYLDRRLVAAHFALGLLLERTGDARGAQRALRNVQRLCDRMLPGDPIPFAGGTCASQLASLAKDREASSLAHAGR